MMEPEQIQNAQIHNLSRADIYKLRAISDQMRKAKPLDYFERNFDFVEKGEREILMITLDGVDAGYCILNWKPKYALFKKLGIPEIQDLNVLSDFRQRGLGTQMILHCEAAARGKGYDQMGIGVGSDSSYGPAQILYTKLGYIPDGNGITYDRKLVAPEEMRPIDDNLCLMMVKNLNVSK